MGMADHDPSAAAPDYDLPDALHLKDAAQYRALFEDTRLQIVGLLLERAATTTELAQVLGRPKGTVGHHLKVLQEAGLVRVVRTQKVRALEAKYYGRTARVFYYEHSPDSEHKARRVMDEAGAELSALLVRRAELSEQDPRGFYNVNRRDARIPAERAAEFSARLNDLLGEFVAEPRGGEVTYAMLFALYATDRPALPDQGQS